jgi:hypothetical protein
MERIIEIGVIQPLTGFRFRDLLAIIGGRPNLNWQAVLIRQLIEL